MTRPDAALEDLVRRTLTDVAAALPVPAAPPSPAPEPALPPAGRPGRTRVAVLAVAAAVVLLAGGVWALTRPADEGSSGISSEERLRPPGADAPSAGWLPDGVDRDGTVSGSEEATTAGVTAVLGTERSDGGVVVAVEGESFERVALVASRAGYYLGAPRTGPMSEPSMALGITPDGRARAAVARGGTPVDASDLGPALARGDLDLAAAVESAGGGRATPLDLSWLPSLGASVSSLYVGEDGGADGRNVWLEAVAADLPAPEVVAAVLGSDTVVDVAGTPATLVVDDASRRLVFQASAGVVGMVSGPWATEELARVAAEADWPAQASAGSPPVGCGAPADDAVRTTGSIGVTSTDDLSYDLTAWEGPFTTSGVPLTCASLDVAGETVVLGTDTARLRPLSAARVDTGPGEAVVLVAYPQEARLFTGPGVSTQGIDVEAPARVELAFVHVDAEGRTEPVPVEVVDPSTGDTVTVHVGL